MQASRRYLNGQVPGQCIEGVLLLPVAVESRWTEIRLARGQTDQHSQLDRSEAALGLASVH